MASRATGEAAPATADAELLYLTGDDVSSALTEVDPIEVAEQTLREHAAGRTDLPDEAYLGWRTRSGHAARSLAMLGLVNGMRRSAGVKIINASLGNTQRGLPRADGLVILFDTETGRPTCVMDAALISATRTAAVSAVAIRTFQRSAAHSLAVIGCGRLAAAHLTLLLRDMPALEEVRVFDISAPAATAFAARHADLATSCGAELSCAASARAAIEGADVVLPVTTVGAHEGYIEPSWLGEHTVVLHVSLDDLLPDAVLQAGTLVVDDWGLVSSDHRRLFGRMLRSGLLCGPGEQPTGRARPVAGEIGDFLPGGTRKADGHGVTVVNPFGMAVQDVALADRVLAAARERGIGMSFTR
jgi:ornithine cyclodeaminase/alanine dehydrogenase-like protein (mu-crystallin family)